MKSYPEIRDKIIAVIEKAYPQYPVEIEAPMEDDQTVDIRVFAVPQDQVKSVKDFIYDLQREIVGGYNFVLLAMVKNIDVTREYYPEYMPASHGLGIWSPQILRDIGDRWFATGIEGSETPSWTGGKSLLEYANEVLKGIGIKEQDLIFNTVNDLSITRIGRASGGLVIDGWDIDRIPPDEVECEDEYSLAA